MVITAIASNPEAVSILKMVGQRFNGTLSKSGISTVLTINDVSEDQLQAFCTEMNELPPYSSKTMVVCIEDGDPPRVIEVFTPKP